MTKLTSQKNRDSVCTLTIYIPITFIFMSLALISTLCNRLLYPGSYLTFSFGRIIGISNLNRSIHSFPKRVPKFFSISFFLIWVNTFTKHSVVQAKNQSPWFSFFHHSSTCSPSVSPVILPPNHFINLSLQLYCYQASPVQTLQNFSNWSLWRSPDVFLLLLYKWFSIQKTE